MLAPVMGHTTFRDIVRRGASGFETITRRNDLERRAALQHRSAAEAAPVASDPRPAHHVQQ